MRITGGQARGIPLSLPKGDSVPLEPWAQYVLHQAHCRVFLTAPPGIPQEVVDKSK